MNVTTTNTGDLNAVLTVEIEPKDYQEKVEKTLKDYRKRANIPGFRPGKVPASLIKKQYGKAVLIEEVNHLLQHAVQDHLQEEKLDILGNPLPVPDETIDWEQQDQFKFDFELGLTPTIEVSIDGKTKVPYYHIVADKK
ncbi:MAG: trigger factor family protein [Owenweeksia sp.]|nr:trigger factor family protein [Owenweeksia sp.]